MKKRLYIDKNDDGDIVLSGYMEDTDVIVRGFNVTAGKRLRKYDRTFIMNGGELNIYENLSLHSILMKGWGYTFEDYTTQATKDLIDKIAPTRFISEAIQETLIFSHDGDRDAFQVMKDHFKQTPPENKKEEIE